MNDRTGRDSYNRSTFLKMFEVMSIIFDVIDEDNQYKYYYEEIFTKDNLVFLHDSYLWEYIEACLQENDDNIDYDELRNQVVCWWEGIDDKVYHQRLDYGEKI